MWLLTQAKQINDLFNILIFVQSTAFDDLSKQNKKTFYKENQSNSNDICHRILENCGNSAMKVMQKIVEIN